MGATSIEWTDASWNPIGGCSIASTGCENCYAMPVAATRLKHHPLYAGTTDIVKGRPIFNGRLTQAPADVSVWTWPQRWKGGRHKRRGPESPALIFVGDMADLFHPDRDLAVIDKVLINGLASPHDLQLLTKRPEVMAAHIKAFNFRRAGCLFPPHDRLWLGFSAERQREFDQRWTAMRELATEGWIIFASLEPLIGPIVLPADFLARKQRSWAIVGGESGPNARSMDPDWPRALRDQCVTAGVPFFMKQMARRAPIPVDLEVRQFPRELGR
jgi:protein gp37